MCLANFHKTAEHGKHCSTACTMGVVLQATVMDIHVCGSRFAVI